MMKKWLYFSDRKSLTWELIEIDLQVFGLIFDPQLASYLVPMSHDGIDGQVQLSGDLLGGHPLFDQQGDLDFIWCKAKII
jgi:hypothetical protein